MICCLNGCLAITPIDCGEQLYCNTPQEMLTLHHESINNTMKDGISVSIIILNAYGENALKL